MAAGIVGALAGTFTDSFWYSAVEGEVYAMSSFFTAIVFWAALKWERVADEPGADRWFVINLSFDWSFNWRAPALFTYVFRQSC